MNKGHPKLHSYWGGEKQLCISQILEGLATNSSSPLSKGRRSAIATDNKAVGILRRILRLPLL